MKENIISEIFSRVLDEEELRKRIIHWINVIESDDVIVLTRSDIKASSYQDNVIRISSHFQIYTT